MTRRPVLYEDATSPRGGAAAFPDLGFSGLGEELDRTLGPHDSTDTPATRLPDAWSGDLEIVEELPGGGTAWLWHARTADGDDVVVRRAHTMSRPGYITLPVLADLEHPHLVAQLREPLTEAGFLWQLLEHCPDGTAKHLRPDEIDLDRLLRDVGAALHHLHLSGIAHTDVKPQNILVRPDGSFVLSDLDTCILVGAEQKPSPDESGHLTRGYAPPDQEYAPEFDWFQLGLTVLNLVVGIEQPGLNWRRVPFAELDERLVVLLSGLMEEDPLRRWGYQQVTEWLDHAADLPPVTTDLREAVTSGAALAVRYGGAILDHPAVLADRMSSDWRAARRALLSRVDGAPWGADLADRLDAYGDRRRGAGVRAIVGNLGPTPTIADLHIAIAHLLVVLDPAGTPRFNPDGQEPVQLDDDGLRDLARQLVEEAGGDPELPARATELVRSIVDLRLLHPFSQLAGRAKLWDLHGRYERALAEYRRMMQAALTGKRRAVEQHVDRSAWERQEARDIYRDTIADRPPEPWELYAADQLREPLGNQERVAADHHDRVTRALLFAYTISPDQTSRLWVQAVQAARSDARNQDWYRALVQHAVPTRGPER
jgi:serine/threonine protein kinase